MGLMRYQPQGRAQLRRDLLGRVVGALFTNERLEIGGSGAEVKLFGNPAQTGAPGHGLARQFSVADATYATITPPPGLIDLSTGVPFVVVCVFTTKVLQTTRLLNYKHALDGRGVTLGFGSSGYLGLYHGSSTGEIAKVSSRTPIEVDTPYIVVTGWDSGGYFMYLNGELRPFSNTSTNFSISNAATTDIYISRRNSGTTYLDGTISLAAHMQGAFDRDFLLSLSRNPWQLFDDLSDDEGLMASASADTSLSGSALVRAAGSGVLSTSVRLAAAAQATSAAAGALSSSIRLAGAAQASASGAAALSSGIRLAGAIAVQSSASGQLQGTAVALSGGAYVQTSAAGVLATSIRLAGLAAGSVSCTGALGFAQAPIESIDVTKISPARIVVFEGSGSRVTPFGSSGSRVTPFDSSGSRVTPFEGSGSKTVRFE